MSIRGEPIPFRAYIPKEEVIRYRKVSQLLLLLLFLFLLQLLLLFIFLILFILFMFLLQLLPLFLFLLLFLFLAPPLFPRTRRPEAGWSTRAANSTTGRCTTSGRP